MAAGDAPDFAAAVLVGAFAKLDLTDNGKWSDQRVYVCPEAGFEFRSDCALFVGTADELVDHEFPDAQMRDALTRIPQLDL